MNRLLNYFISKNIFKLEEIGIKESYKIKFLNLSNFNINKENIEDTINNLNNIIINNKNFVIEINEMIKTTTNKDYNTNYNYLEIAEKNTATYEESNVPSFQMTEFEKRKKENQEVRSFLINNHHLYPSY
jgi:lipopolysaccharide biosynthesis regulator YciM